MTPRRRFFKALLAGLAGAAAARCGLPEPAPCWRVTINGHDVTPYLEPAGLKLAPGLEAMAVRDDGLHVEIRNGTGYAVTVDIDREGITDAVLDAAPREVYRIGENGREQRLFVSAPPRHVRRPDYAVRRSFEAKL